MTSSEAAAAVQHFYERYPYPPAVESLDRYRSLWEDGKLRRQDHHLFWPARPFRDDHSVLVAGCGTSQAAKYAMRWPAARVIGIDFSAASIRCTEELKQRYELANLQLHLLPIERAAELEIRFDQIVCTGVLHHLADPAVGLRVLRELLEPDGAMLLMLYAPYGRAGIYMMQEFCRRLGITGTESGIRDLVATLSALPPGHPLRALREAPDFHSVAAIADALLNPHDRAYTVAQLFELLESARLTFGRWVRQAPYSPRCGLMAYAARATRIAQLSLAEQFAAVELLRGTMTRHNVIVHRDDGAARAQRLNFADDGSLDYVPIRASDTISVQERLPAGIAAVLINRKHSCTDLTLPITQREKRWFDAIDGRRTIGEMGAPKADRADIRAFFERLWWYDQVVFDASLSRAA
ncbi:MAG TPA: class I SAM-dependent methyltransferase [Gemmatimonadaceae bacterium]|jgi:SAM-dependent methyltransferase